MPNYRRARVPGGSYFFTLVVDGRRKLFSNSAARALLGSVLRRCQNRRPFRINAIVLLPDHLHAIWTLPPNDADYSTRWNWIKGEFTGEWIQIGGSESPISEARRNEGRRGIWQPRFWEHTLETEDDFERHFDYIHYNPVKHGYVKCPRDWECSSFHRLVKEGVLPEHWACWSDGRILDFTDIDHTVGE
jgi:putative transposase